MRPRVLGVALLASHVAGTAVAMRTNRPGRFLGITTGLSAERDFLHGIGTALAGPLLMLIAGAAAVALLGSRRHRRAALVVLAVLGMGTVVGQLGEPVMYHVLSTSGFEPAAAVVVLANLALGASLAVACIRALRADRAPHAAMPDRRGAPLA